MLQATMAHVLSNYAQVCCNGNEELARLELKRQLRDRLIFERQVHRFSMPFRAMHLFRDGESSPPFAMLVSNLRGLLI